MAQSHAPACQNLPGSPRSWWHWPSLDAGLDSSALLPHELHPRIWGLYFGALLSSSTYSCQYLFHPGPSPPADHPMPAPGRGGQGRLARVCSWRRCAEVPQHKQCFSSSHLSRLACILERDPAATQLSVLRPKCSRRPGGGPAQRADQPSGCPAAPLGAAMARGWPGPCILCAW